jgi:hypothetical protein
MLQIEVHQSEALSAPAHFGIPPHIHVCVTATGSVILDVRRDKYLGLGRNETELLADAVAGWPQPLWPRNTCSPPLGILQATNELCKSLVADGVLESLQSGKEARVVPTFGAMRGDWVSIGDEYEIRGRVTLRHIGNFLAAYVWARRSLTWRPFSLVVEDVSRSKRQRAREMDRRDLRKLAVIVDVFRRLRPFAFAAEGRCLLHALTLTRFLSKYQIYPEWVIGVTTQPWGAHSWVQWDNFLLDSNPEKVCAYTPIMMV